MAGALHVIWGVYGLWLPRSPEGSWSDFVRQWELALYGRTQSPMLGAYRQSEQFIASRQAAEGRWKGQFQPFTDRQRSVIGGAIESFMRRHRSTIWASAILPTQVQLVLNVSPLERTDISITLRSEITKRLNGLILGKPDSTKYWAAARWRYDLESDAEVSTAIEYVNGLYEVEQTPPIHTRLACRETAESYRLESIAA